jgi:hypothetical protein
MKKTVVTSMLTLCIICLNAQAPFDGFLYMEQRSYASAWPGEQPPGSNNFPSLGVPCTFEFFYNPVDTMMGGGPIFSTNENLCYFDQSFFDICNGLPSLTYDNGITSVHELAVSDIEYFNHWHHIAIEVKYDSGNIVYDVGIDGKFVFSTISYGAPYPIFATSVFFRLGSSAFYSSPYSVPRVYLDDFRISSSLRYGFVSLNLGTSYTIPTSEFVTDANTTILWHFNEANNDSSFYDATLSNVNLNGYYGARILRTELPIIPSPGLSVFVSYDSSGAYHPVNNAKVYCVMVNVDTSVTYSTVIDSAYTNAAGYAFIDSYQAPYVIWAYPDTNIYPGTIPTYEATGNPVYMTMANVDSLATCNYTTHVIILENASQVSGSGSIGGFFILGGRANNDPVSNLNILLSNGSVINFGKTNSNGYFNFTHLPPGWYDVTLDAWGLIGNTISFYLAPGDSHSDSLIFILYPDHVELLGYMGYETEVFQQLQVYPNPISDQINIQFTKNEPLSYHLMDINGTSILSGVLVNKSIPVSEDLPKGIYLLELRTADERMVIKLVK